MSEAMLFQQSPWAAKGADAALALSVLSRLLYVIVHPNLPGAGELGPSPSAQSSSFLGADHGRRTDLPAKIALYQVGGGPHD